MEIPRHLNIGSGKNFREDCLNIDINKCWNPDIVYDLNELFPPFKGAKFMTSRFGEIAIEPGQFTKILAFDVLEHIQNLQILMTSCLNLLQENGVFEIVVPYDMSLGAWQDPTHVRTFNENSWLYYTDWFWYLNWQEARFKSNPDIALNLSKYGEALKNAGKSIDEIVRTPRAVDSMIVKLEKVLLNTEDNIQLRHFVSKAQIPDSKYSIWKVNIDKYEHNSVFDDMAILLKSAFNRLGYDTPIVIDQADIKGTGIVLGCNNIPKAGFKNISDNLILFNLEQVQKDSPWINDTYIDLLKKHEVWDYSEQNIINLKKLGIDNVKHCEIGYEPELTVIPKQNEDIDILFYGSLNQRRANILQALKEKGWNVVHLFGVYGKKRDEYISRAKIVLNIHFYDAMIFEIVRVSYLMANSKFVISEIPADINQWDILSEGIVFTEYNDIVKTCEKYLNDPIQREKIAKTGFELYSKRPQKEFLQKVLTGNYEKKSGVSGAKSFKTEKHPDFCTNLYLDLIEKCITNTIYEDPPMDKWSDGTFNYKKRMDGLDWPSKAHTMIGEHRMNNIRMLSERVITEGIPGDFIETGIWRGGACIFMRAILKAYGITDRIVWCADSFEGLPVPDAKKYPQDAGDAHFSYDELKVSIEDVKSNFKKYGLLDSQVKFLKGWFKDTLPNAPIESLAIMRLDGDIYESTIQALESLYHKLTPGGYAIIDDYGAIKQCRDAVEDFRNKNNITESIINIDSIGVYWQKK